MLMLVVDPDPELEGDPEAPLLELCRFWSFWRMFCALIGRVGGVIFRGLRCSAERALFHSSENLKEKV